MSVRLVAQRARLRRCFLALPNFLIILVLPLAASLTVSLSSRHWPCLLSVAADAAAASSHHIVRHGRGQLLYTQPIVRARNHRLSAAFTPVFSFIPLQNRPRLNHITIAYYNVDSSIIFPHFRSRRSLNWGALNPGFRNTPSGITPQNSRPRSTRKSLETTRIAALALRYCSRKKVRLAGIFPTFSIHFPNLFALHRSEASASISLSWIPQGPWLHSFCK